MVIVLVVFDLMYLLMWNVIHPLHDSLDEISKEVGD